MKLFAYQASAKAFGNSKKWKKKHSGIKPSVKKIKKKGYTVVKFLIKWQSCR